MSGHHKQSGPPTTTLSTINRGHIKVPQNPFHVCKRSVVPRSGKNSHGKNNTFLQSDWSTFTRLVKMLLYSCGYQEEQCGGRQVPSKSTMKRIIAHLSSHKMLLSLSNSNIKFSCILERRVMLTSSPSSLVCVCVCRVCTRTCVEWIHVHGVIGCECRGG